MQKLWPEKVTIEIFLACPSDDHAISPQSLYGELVTCGNPLGDSKSVSKP
jgi:hypothetical protein